MKTPNKKMIALFCFLILSTMRIFAAGADKEYKSFCAVMEKLIAATDDGFEKISGTSIESEDGFLRWNSQIGFPGVEKSIVVDEMVVSKYYSGTFKSTSRKEEIQAQYEKYSQYLAKYMTSIGYKVQQSPNETGAPDFQDIIYRLPEDSPLPIEKQPFIKMHINFNNETDLYTMVIEVYQNFL